MADENTVEGQKSETHVANTAAMVDMYEAFMAELDAIAAGQAAREAIQ